MVFTLLALRAAAARGQRAWLVAAGLAVWASFGAGAGLLTLLRLLPGVEALRATGRFQVLVPLLLLPPLVIWLGEQRGWRRALPLDRDFDALLVPATSTDWPRFSLRARAPGLLDHASLGSCSLVRTLSWGPLPLGSTRLWLDARSLRGPWLRAGEPGLELEPRQQWLRWPAPLRPAIALAVQCD